LDACLVIFTFHKDAGEKEIELKGESFKYLIKVRRHKIGDIIAMRQYTDRDNLYRYKLQSIDSRRAVLLLQDMQKYTLKASKNLHLGWCIIDTKSIEKVLPMLNESGVYKITFITCKRSQKNFKLDFERFNRILDTSSQQCGRSEIMSFDTCSCVKDFLQQYPKTAIFDFGGKDIENSEDIETVLVGCEGGFSEDERKLFDTNRLFTFKTPMILRSETAVVAISNQILL
jgi:16S rRNA (uracil1498-N3)-methyltransferase